MNSSKAIQEVLLEMLNQSVQVITKPSVATFEQYEDKGTMREALIYVAVGAAISGIFGIFSSGLLGFLAGIASTLVGFFVFTYVVHWFGKQQGGTGSLDHVAYTFSLFWVPIGLLGAVLALVLAISIVGLLLIWAVPLVIIAAYIYYGYLAVQSSMNIHDNGKAIVTMLVAGAATFVVQIVVSSVLS